MLWWVLVGCGGQIYRFGHCGFVVVRFIGWLDFFFFFSAIVVCGCGQWSNSGGVGRGCCCWVCRLRLMVAVHC